MCKEGPTKLDKNLNILDVYGCMTSKLRHISRWRQLQVEMEELFDAKSDEQRQLMALYELFDAKSDMQRRPGVARQNYDAIKMTVFTLTVI